MAYLIPDVPKYIQQLMQRELHLAKEARYSEAFSTLHEERRKTKGFDELAAEAIAMRLSSDDAASPDELHEVAWDDDAAWKNVTTFSWNAFPVFLLFVSLFY